MKIPKDPSWQRLIQQAEGLLSVSSNRISNAANLSALLFQELVDVSWVGFYFLYDAAARSEIVVPIFKAGELLGVLDVDSIRLDRFSEEDEAGLTALARVYESSVV